MSALDGLVIKDMLIQHALSECIRLRRESTNLYICVFQIKGGVELVQAENSSRFYICFCVRNGTFSNLKNGRCDHSIDGRCNHFKVAFVSTPKVVVGISFMSSMSNR